MCPGMADATIGLPAAIASRTASGSPSNREGATTTSACASTGHGVVHEPEQRHTAVKLEPADQVLDRVALRPVAEQAGVHGRRQQRQRLKQGVVTLLRAKLGDHHDRRAGRQVGRPGGRRRRDHDPVLDDPGSIAMAARGPS